MPYATVGRRRILLPYRIHRAGYSDAVATAQAAVGNVGNPVTDVSINGAELVVTFADGTTESHALPAGGGGGGGPFTGTADLLVERIGTLDNPTLPDDRAWLGTNVIIPDGVHVLLIDAGQASDDYHLVDWDVILTLIPVVAGAISMAGEFETFQGDAFTYLRIGHGANNEVLIANDSTGSINLAHVHIERLLAPIGAGGGNFNGVDQTARDSAQAAQDTADTAEVSAAGAQTSADTAQVTADAATTPSEAAAQARSVTADWAEQDNQDNIPLSKLAESTPAAAWAAAGVSRPHRFYWVSTGTAPVQSLGEDGDAALREFAGVFRFYEKAGGVWSQVELINTTLGSATLHYLTALPAANLGADGDTGIWRDTTVSPWLIRFYEKASGAWAQRFTWQAAASSGGLNEGAVDARIMVLVQNWAFDNNVVIPDAKLPVGRFVPFATGATDGQVAKVLGGQWVIGDDQQGEGGGGVGVPVTTTKENITYKRCTLLADLDSQAITANDWFTVPQHITGNNLVCPATGEIEVLLWAKSGNRDNSVAYLKTPADSLRVTPSLGEMQIPFGANRWIGVRTNSLVDNEIQVKVQDAQAAAGGNFSITINHIEELTQEVVTDVTGNVIGGGGEGLTAAGITGITAAPNDAVHSSTVFPGVFGGVLHKFSFGNLIALMRSTVGLGRRINPGGSNSNLGKVPVLHVDGADFDYQLQSPTELPYIASNLPNSPDNMNPAILYKDTPEGDTANGIYYRRKHDRESVIIAINDTSPRSFGTEHRSFGWTSRIILDTAEPVPGVTPYPSVPPHWEAFIRVQNIASGLYEWRLYTDEMFTTEDPIYLDMRDQDDPDTHIQNVQMIKPVNEAYWTTGTYTFNTFPFYGIAGRAKRPIIRIRNADDTLSTSIIHLIPIDDVREELVDEDRLHQAYADLLDIITQHIDNIPSGGGGATPTYTELISTTAVSGTHWVSTTGGWWERI